jgi:hypothetical protein
MKKPEWASDLPKSGQSQHLGSALLTPFQPLLTLRCWKGPDAEVEISLQTLEVPLALPGQQLWGWLHDTGLAT